jgi:hypothetical protein
MEHAISVKVDTKTETTTLTCTCGESTTGRSIEVLEMWAQWHLRTHERVESEGTTTNGGVQ